VNVPFLDLVLTHSKTRGEFLAAMVSVYDSSWFILETRLKNFNVIGWPVILLPLAMLKLAETIHV